MREFELKTEYIELLKLIKVMRWGNTGGEGKMFVDEQMIKVNGTIEHRYRAKLRENDVVEFQDFKVKIVKASASEN